MGRAVGNLTGPRESVSKLSVNTQQPSPRTLPENHNIHSVWFGQRTKSVIVIPQPESKAPRGQRGTCPFYPVTYILPRVITGFFFLIRKAPSTLSFSLEMEAMIQLRKTTLHCWFAAPRSSSRDHWGERTQSSPLKVGPSEHTQCQVRKATSCNCWEPESWLLWLRAFEFLTVILH